MAQVPSDPNVSTNGAVTDRRSGTRLNALRRAVINMIHSRWVASFIVATAVSWSFSEFDEIQDRKFERQQAVTMCVVEGVAREQSIQHKARVDIRPILEGCDKQHGN